MRTTRRVLAGVTAGLVLALATVVPAQADQVRELEYWLNDYGITQAWQASRGAGVKVAIIDTGVDGSVPDLAGAVVGGTDVSGVGSANGQKPLGNSDESAHGTWVASLLAGRGTGTNTGVMGVAPAASILTVSVALGGVPGALNVDEQIATGVRWAVDHGASVINMSLTRNTLDWPPSWDSAFQYAFDHDVVIVAAAGNRGSGTTEVGAPATIPGVLTVAGVDRNGHASFDASSQGITIGVSAPSEQLVGANPGGGYVQWEGTSGAAPLVAGIVALVRAAHPHMNAANVIERVVKTAKAVGSVPSPIYGYGLVSANAAVTATVPTVKANPMGDLAEWIRIHRRAQATDAPKSPSSAPAAAPVALAPENTVNVANLLVPRWGLVTSVGIPTTLLLCFLALVVLGALAARRHFRRATGRE
ncbi:S8 family serine peptidase [Leifsonia sp. Root112D2]|uniref:S8 family serine peptidase n=1 Tax=Leifsonia sp. Root112D2 TaxID=1736426 RepID=UPI0006F3EAAE|nr:S8 family serine peptidase [Leifsonia sp. Root112D2]KQV08462.1 peptidase S8 [Leifsonia sp. Root112D2]